MRSTPVAGQNVVAGRTAKPLRPLVAVKAFGREAAAAKEQAAKEAAAREAAARKNPLNMLASILPKAPEEQNKIKTRPDPPKGKQEVKLPDVKAKAQQATETAKVALLGKDKTLPGMEVSDADTALTKEIKSGLQGAPARAREAHLKEHPEDAEQEKLRKWPLGPWDPNSRNTVAKAPQDAAKDAAEDKQPKKWPLGPWDPNADKKAQEAVAQAEVEKKPKWPLGPWDPNADKKAEAAAADAKKVQAQAGDKTEMVKNKWGANILVASNNVPPGTKSIAKQAEDKKAEEGKHKWGFKK